MSDTLNLVLFDVDGCIFNRLTKYFKDDAHIQEWLIQLNQTMLAQHIQRVKIEKYNRVIYALISKRQDKEIDFANSATGGSLAPILPIIQSYTQNELEAETLIELALTADFFANHKNAGMKAPGDTYISILKELYCNAKEEKFANSFFDNKKILNTYMQIHRAAVLNPQAKEIVVDLYDDETDALEALHAYFSALDGTLLPKHVKLRLHHHNGEVLQQYKTDIQGTGSIDYNYEWSIRYFAAKRYLFKNSAGEDHHIKTAEELYRFHMNDHMHLPNRKREINLDSDKLDPKKFLDFRDTEIVKLANQSRLQAIPSYTTAQQLHQRGFIPTRFILNKKPNHLLSTASCVTWNQHPQAQNVNAQAVTQAVYPTFQGRT